MQAETPTPYFLPSEICRLVLGFLKEENYKETYRCFLRECPHLSEYESLRKKGLEYPTRIMNLSMVMMLNEYGNLKLQSLGVQRSAPSQPSEVTTLVNQIETVVSALKHNSRLSQIHPSVRGRDQSSRTKHMTRQRMGLTSRCNPFNWSQSQSLNVTPAASQNVTSFPGDSNVSQVSSPGSHSDSGRDADSDTDIDIVSHNSPVTSTPIAGSRVGVGVLLPSTNTLVLRCGNAAKTGNSRACVGNVTQSSSLSSDIVPVASSSAPSALQPVNNSFHPGNVQTVDERCRNTHRTGSQTSALNNPVSSTVSQEVGSNVSSVIFTDSSGTRVDGAVHQSTLPVITSAGTSVPTFTQSHRIPSSHCAMATSSGHLSSGSSIFVTPSSHPSPSKLAQAASGVLLSDDEESVASNVLEMDIGRLEDSSFKKALSKRRKKPPRRRSEGVLSESAGGGGSENRLDKIINSSRFVKTLVDNINKSLYDSQKHGKTAAVAEKSTGHTAVRSQPTPSTSFSLATEDSHLEKFLNRDHQNMSEEAVHNIISMTRNDPTFDELFEIFNADREEFIRQEFGGGSQSGLNDNAATPDTREGLHTPPPCSDTDYPVPTLSGPGAAPPTSSATSVSTALNFSTVYIDINSMSGFPTISDPEEQGASASLTAHHAKQQNRHSESPKTIQTSVTSEPSEISQILHESQQKSADLQASTSQPVPGQAATLPEEKVATDHVTGLAAAQQKTVPCEDEIALETGEREVVEEVGKSQEQGTVSSLGIPLQGVAACDANSILISSNCGKVVTENSSKSNVMNSDSSGGSDEQKATVDNEHNYCHTDDVKGVPMDYREDSVSYCSFPATPRDNDSVAVSPQRSRWGRIAATQPSEDTAGQMAFDGTRSGAVVIRDDSGKSVYSEHDCKNIQTDGSVSELCVEQNTSGGNQVSKDASLKSSRVSSEFHPSPTHRRPSFDTQQVSSADSRPLCEETVHRSAEEPQSPHVLSPQSQRETEGSTALQQVAEGPQLSHEAQDESSFPLPQELAAVETSEICVEKVQAPSSSQVCSLPTALQESHEISQPSSLEPEPSPVKSVKSASVGSQLTPLSSASVDSHSSLLGVSASQTAPVLQSPAAPQVASESQPHHSSETIQPSSSNEQVCPENSQTSPAETQPFLAVSQQTPLASVQNSAHSQTSLEVSQRAGCGTNQERPSSSRLTAERPQPPGIPSKSKMSRVTSCPLFKEDFRSQKPSSLSASKSHLSLKRLHRSQRSRAKSASPAKSQRSSVQVHAFQKKSQSRGSPEDASAKSPKSYVSPRHQSLSSAISQSGTHKCPKSFAKSVSSPSRSPRSAKVNVFPEKLQRSPANSVESHPSPAHLGDTEQEASAFMRLKQALQLQFSTASGKTAKNHSQHSQHSSSSATNESCSHSNVCLTKGTDDQPSGRSTQSQPSHDSESLHPNPDHSDGVVDQDRESCTATTDEHHDQHTSPHSASSVCSRADTLQPPCTPPRSTHQSILRSILTGSCPATLQHLYPCAPPRSTSQNVLRSTPTGSHPANLQHLYPCTPPRAVSGMSLFSPLKSPRFITTRSTPRRLLNEPIPEEMIEEISRLSDSFYSSPCDIQSVSQPGSVFTSPQGQEGIKKPKLHLHDLLSASQHGEESLVQSERVSASAAEVHSHSDSQHSMCSFNAASHGVKLMSEKDAGLHHPHASHHSASSSPHVAGNFAVPGELSHHSDSQGSSFYAQTEVCSISSVVSGRFDQQSSQSLCSVRSSHCGTKTAEASNASGRSKELQVSHRTNSSSTLPTSSSSGVENFRVVGRREEVHTPVQRSPLDLSVYSTQLQRKGGLIDVGGMIPAADDSSRHSAVIFSTHVAIRPVDQDVERSGDGSGSKGAGPLRPVFGGENEPSPSDMFISTEVSEDACRTNISSFLPDGVGQFLANEVASGELQLPLDLTSGLTILKTPNKSCHSVTPKKRTPKRTPKKLSPFKQLSAHIGRFASLSKMKDRSPRKSSPKKKFSPEKTETRDTRHSPQKTETDTNMNDRRATLRSSRPFASVSEQGNPLRRSTRNKSNSNQSKESSVIHAGISEVKNAGPKNAAGNCEKKKAVSPKKMTSKKQTVKESSESDDILIYSCSDSTSDVEFGEAKTFLVSSTDKPGAVIPSTPQLEVPDLAASKEGQESHQCNTGKSDSTPDADAPSTSLQGTDPEKPILVSVRPETSQLKRQCVGKKNLRLMKTNALCHSPARRLPVGRKNLSLLRSKAVSPKKRQPIGRKDLNRVRPRTPSPRKRYPIGRKNINLLRPRSPVSPSESDSEASSEESDKSCSLEDSSDSEVDICELSDDDSGSAQSSPMKMPATSQSQKIRQAIRAAKRAASLLKVTPGKKKGSPATTKAETNASSSKVGKQSPKSVNPSAKTGSSSDRNNSQGSEMKEQPQDVIAKACQNPLTRSTVPPRQTSPRSKTKSRLSLTKTDPNPSTRSIRTTPKSSSQPSPSKMPTSTTACSPRSKAKGKSPGTPHKGHPSTKVRSEKYSPKACSAPIAPAEKDKADTTMPSGQHGQTTGWGQQNQTFRFMPVSQPQVVGIQKQGPYRRIKPTMISKTVSSFFSSVRSGRTGSRHNMFDIGPVPSPAGSVFSGASPATSHSELSSVFSPPPPPLPSLHTQSSTTLAPACTLSAASSKSLGSVSPREPSGSVMSPPCRLAAPIPSATSTPFACSSAPRSSTGTVNSKSPVRNAVPKSSSGQSDPSKTSARVSVDGLTPKSCDRGPVSKQSGRSNVRKSAGDGRSDFTGGLSLQSHCETKMPASAQSDQNEAEYQAQKSAAKADLSCASKKTRSDLKAPQKPRRGKLPHKKKRPEKGDLPSHAKKPKRKRKPPQPSASSSLASGSVTDMAAEQNLQDKATMESEMETENQQAADSFETGEAVRVLLELNSTENRQNSNSVPVGFGHRKMCNDRSRDMKEMIGAQERVTDDGMGDQAEGVARAEIPETEVRLDKTGGNAASFTAAGSSNKMPGRERNCAHQAGNVDEVDHLSIPDASICKAAAEKKPVGDVITVVNSSNEESELPDLVSTASTSCPSLQTSNRPKRRHSPRKTPAKRARLEDGDTDAACQLLTREDESMRGTSCGNRNSNRGSHPFISMPFIGDVSMSPSKLRTIEDNQSRQEAINIIRIEDNTPVAVGNTSSGQATSGGAALVADGRAIVSKFSSLLDQMESGRLDSSSGNGIVTAMPDNILPSIQATTLGCATTGAQNPAGQEVQAQNCPVVSSQPDVLAQCMQIAFFPQANTQGEYQFGVIHEPPPVSQNHLLLEKDLQKMKKTRAGRRGNATQKKQSAVLQRTGRANGTQRHQSVPKLPLPMVTLTNNFKPKGYRMLLPKTMQSQETTGENPYLVLDNGIPASTGLPSSSLPSNPVAAGEVAASGSSSAASTVSALTKQPPGGVVTQATGVAVQPALKIPRTKPSTKKSKKSRKRTATAAAETADIQPKKTSSASRRRNRIRKKKRSSTNVPELLASPQPLIIADAGRVSNGEQGQNEVLARANPTRASPPTSAQDLFHRMMDPSQPVAVSVPESEMSLTDHDALTTLVPVSTLPSFSSQDGFASQDCLPVLTSDPTPELTAGQAPAAESVGAIQKAVTEPSVHSNLLLVTSSSSAGAGEPAVSAPTQHTPHDKKDSLPSVAAEQRQQVHPAARKTARGLASGKRHHEGPVTASAVSVSRTCPPAVFSTQGLLHNHGSGIGHTLRVGAGAGDSPRAVQAAEVLASMADLEASREARTFGGESCPAEERAHMPRPVNKRLPKLDRLGKIDIDKLLDKVAQKKK